MDNFDLPAYEPATPEYVLAVIRDHHRQGVATDPEVDPGASLTFQTTVAEWREACDLLPWKQLAAAENEMWGFNRPEAEWRAVLLPESKRTLADVCAFIATHARRPASRSVRLFGHTCDKAGAFLAIRAMLQSAGVDTDHVAPSSPLAPYTRRHGWKFVLVMSKLAPGVLPPARVNHPLYDRIFLVMLSGLLAVFIGILIFFVHVIGLHIAVVGGLAFAIAYATHWSVIPNSLPESVTFGELRTFRDLAELVAADQLVLRRTS